MGIAIVHIVCPTIVKHIHSTLQQQQKEYFSSFFYRLFDNFGNFNVGVLKCWLVRPFFLLFFILFFFGFFVCLSSQFMAIHTIRTYRRIRFVYLCLFLWLFICFAKSIAEMQNGCEKNERTHIQTHGPSSQIDSSEFM